MKKVATFNLGSDYQTPVPINDVALKRQANSGVYIFVCIHNIA